MATSTNAGTETPPGTPRQVSGMMSRLVVASVRRRAGDDGVRRLFEAAGETAASAAALEDGASWCSFGQIQALLEAAADVLDDPEAGRAIGAEILKHGVATPLVVMLRALGSPGAVFRNLVRVSRRFNAEIETELASLGPSSAVIAYRYPEEFGLRPSYCRFVAGIVSQVPVLFGLPPGAVAHGECQARGDSRCAYRISWASRSRLPWRARHRRLERAEAQAADVADRLEALHSTVADLVSAGEEAEVLQRIADRAGTAVRAHRYLLAVRSGPGDEVRVQSSGFDGDEAGRVASEVLGADPGADGDRLVVDVASARRHYGRLAAFAAPGAGFFDEERRLLSSYARCAAAALDAATAVAEARVLTEVAHRRGETAAVLLDLARRLANVASVGDAAARLAAAVPAVVGADRSVVVLWDPESETARVAGAHGWSDDLDAALRTIVLRPSDTPVIGRMLAEPEPRFFDRTTDDDFIAGLFATFGGVAMALTPIEAHGEVLGVVLADWADLDAAPAFDATLRERLAGLADQGASALTGARLLEQVTHQAHHDPLTGLPNRALFADRADRALVQARRAPGRCVAVLFLDLDGFKEVNDTLGHAVGDDLLRQVAGRLTGLVRGADTVARLGGDEFVVLLPEVTSVDAVGLLADKVLAAAAEPFLVGHHELGVTASVGAVVSSGADHAEALLRDADEAMYRAKTAGRATWRLHGHGATPSSRPTQPAGGRR